MKPDILDKGLPSAPDVERLVLGMVLLNDEFYGQVSEVLSTSDFSLESHRRIFSAMQEMHSRSERIDRVTIVDELQRVGYLESVGGLSYIVSLDDGLPELAHIGSYLKIIKDKSQLRQIIFAAESVKQRAMLAEDAPQIIAAAGEDLLRPITWGDGGRRKAKTVDDAIDAIGGINAFLDPASQPPGIMTGFTSFDEYTNGLFGDQLVIIGARPSMGKTAFAGNVADHVSLDKPVSFFSLEMNAASILRRMACARAKVDTQRFRKGHTSKDERERVRYWAMELRKRPLYFYDRPDQTVESVCNDMRDAVSHHGVMLGIGDHLGLFRTQKRFQTMDLETGYITRSLKMLSKELDRPFMVLVQLSRDSERRGIGVRPELKDLRNSGNIEQDADIVAFLFREEYYIRDREDLKGKAELIIRKQRDGPLNTCHLRFVHQWASFENREDLLPYK